MLDQILADSDKHHTRAQLGNTKVGGIEQMPICPIAQGLQLACYFLSVINEYGIQQAAHVFEHHGLRAGFIDDADGLGEHVALVIGSELLACLGERWAWHAAGDKVYTFESSGIECRQIALVNMPTWTVVPEGCAGVGVNFNQRLMLKTSAF